MHIQSATFIKGAVGTDEVFEDGHPHIALIGRSNVGKSSVINALTGQKGLAKTSSYPGRTQQINIFLVNHAWYFIDLPGYGFAKGSRAIKERLQELITWYLFRSPYQQKKVVLIIDALLGWKESDREILEALEAHEKKVIVVANKIDKLKRSEYSAQLAAIREGAGTHKVFPFSATKKIGVQAVIDAVLAR